MPSDARTGRLLEMTRNRGRGKMPRYRQNKATRVRREAVMRGLSIHLAYSYTVSQLLSGGILGGNREGSAFERVELVAKRRGLALPSLPPARRDKGGASLLHRRAVPATTYPPPSQSARWWRQRKEEEGGNCVRLVLNTTTTKYLSLHWLCHS